MAVPDWIVYPGDEWARLSPAEAGLREPAFSDLVGSHAPRPSTFWGERHAADEFGAVLTRGGYVVVTWGDWRGFRYQSASVGKAFTLAVLGLAVERLGLNVAEPVWRTWTGTGQLSHPHKYMDSEGHRAITWRHLAEHEAGYALENACHWRKGLIPEESWIRDAWSGDPLFDMYALRPPGTRFYSSGNYVRLGQALTALWAMDLKELLDRELFCKIGIPADTWEWMSLRDVHEARDLYPEAPGYGEYADPPFTIGGVVVRGGPGWVCMSAAALARFGLLVATGGIWKGERLLGPEWLMSKSGGNWSAVVGDPATCVAGARVATEGLPPFLWAPDFEAYRFPSDLIGGPPVSVRRL